MAARYGIVGYPLSHSSSPAYFRAKFQQLHIDAVYDTYPLTDVQEFPALMEKYTDWRGLSVTIPYKESIIPYLDEADESALEVGAVNSIRIRNGLTRGYNTDITGFEQSLKPLLAHRHTHALVLGTGGASKAVCYVLRKLGIVVQLVSRSKKTGCITYDTVTAETLRQHLLIVNTTPCGMYPAVNEAPAIPYPFIGPDHLLYDLIYNPAETLFLQKGIAMGATVKNGLEMLHLQADASWKIWNDQPTV